MMRHFMSNFGIDQKTLPTNSLSVLSNPEYAFTETEEGFWCKFQFEIVDILGILSTISLSSILSFLRDGFTYQKIGG